MYLVQTLCLSLVGEENRSSIREGGSYYPCVRKAAI